MISEISEKLEVRCKHQAPVLDAGNLKIINSKAYQTHMDHHKQSTDIKITALHHGKYPNTGFSFSTMLWDYMFGTEEAVKTEQMIKFYSLTTAPKTIANTRKY